MAMRPTDIQLILQVSRDVERIQHLQQQYTRQQQEQLAAYMKKNLEEKRKKTESLTRTDKTQLRPVAQREERKERGKKEKNRDKDKKLGMHIDIIA